MTHRTRLIATARVCGRVARRTTPGRLGLPGLLVMLAALELSVFAVEGREARLIFDHCLADGPWEPWRPPSAGLSTVPE